MPHHLPLPFPRYFTPHRLASDGKLKFYDEKKKDEEKDPKKDEFVESCASLVKLTQDATYH
eukprot:CAMPEP_0116875420 /NCGR_PEP_ID=MMETSP0463-20121206/7364_1 /TAXON_ID=181622 /ORGANISM="Strombidinopsis sp, Strain SopsisLIS2011" /LENGTH=60 /DNA_ID=CAMNT_0004521011 /DNA_START=1513 /DNA_END=1695 /DNA_ORIENTATION=-